MTPNPFSGATSWMSYRLSLHLQRLGALDHWRWWWASCVRVLCLLMLQPFHDFLTFDIFIWSKVKPGQICFCVLLSLSRFMHYCVPTVLFSFLWVSIVYWFNVHYLWWYKCSFIIKRALICFCVSFLATAAALWSPLNISLIIESF